MSTLLADPEIEAVGQKAGIADDELGAAIGAVVYDTRDGRIARRIDRRAMEDRLPLRCAARGGLVRQTVGLCGRGFWPRFLFTWPGTEIATMSADVASNVMLELRRASMNRGEADPAELDALEREVRAQYARQSDPYYATSRLWDDGIIEPAQTRDVMGLCLALAHSTPPDTGFTPVFRM